tara:strand:+ start:394 stop:816 length:423 start_codon:yes stop_codon:yes gene_type:complete
MKILKGYIFSRKLLNGEYVTQKIQNLTIRESCKLQNFELELSSAEYIMDNSYLVLKNLIKNLKKIDGIAFFSLFQLPNTSIERLEIYKNILNQNKIIYFCNEKIVIKNFIQIDLIENIIKITELLKFTPTKKELENKIQL